MRNNVINSHHTGIQIEHAFACVLAITYFSDLLEAQILMCSSG